MGQYYMPVLRDKNGKLSTFYSHDYGNGLKLMEHSYVGNSFVNAVCNQIYKNPHYVCWSGDYIELDEVMQLPWIDNEDQADKYMDEIWENKQWRVEPSEENTCFDWSDNNYLINHSKKIFLKIPKDGDWIIHPLPILTAISNGRGGGDYRGVNEERAGEWWGDLIEISDKKPIGYNFIKLQFIEYGLEERQ